MLRGHRSRKRQPGDGTISIWLKRMVGRYTWALISLGCVGCWEDCVYVCSEMCWWNVSVLFECIVYCEGLSVTTGTWKE